ncbi:acyltransferase family protein [Haoranjiania flava]|uniref:Acyltransferase n=1 Tax=Haoranjiania flava TaxID=1856322 RepID=A0AAE3ILE2_9BACT|nr:acyltransferase [Haoranjiania flava]MCU7693814.1 acyltransferase [Haoranjiania flava]
MSEISSAAFKDSKPHYIILNGLRGVAAIVVLVYHAFEAFATSQLDQVVNHGYLAVDFFFILSGFVIGYAYDDRWDKMSVKDFLKRRVIRLHPMVILGAVIGAIMFYFQDYAPWNVSAVPVISLLLATLLSAFLIPMTPGTEIRGIGEMFPLNGPSWSLFFEYIGNILYAVLIRRLTTNALAVLVFLAALGLAGFAVFGPLGSIGVGWTLMDSGFFGGLLRLLFSFSAGLLLSRIFKPTYIKGAFWICTLVIIALLSLPRIGGDKLWINGVYESICVIIVFPVLVFVGASGRTTGKGTARLCKFLGDISYPLYMVHYPFLYLYYAWVKNGNLSFQQSLPGAIAFVAGSILLAWLSLKLYDEPVRKFLTKRLLRIDK